jgi:hypothetical protein
VAEVPQGQRAGVVGDAGDLGYVGDPARPVGYVAEQHQRGVLVDHLGDLGGVDAGARVGVDPHQLEAPFGRDALQHVAVGGEVVGVQHHPGAAGAGVDGGAGQLVDQHGGGVPDHHLARRGAQGHRAEPVAEGERPLHPALVPAADQAARPAPADEVVEQRRGGRQRAAQRVAVQVGHQVVLGGGEELVAVAGQRVGRVQRGGPAQQVVGHCGMPISVRTAYSSGKKVRSRTPLR